MKKNQAHAIAKKAAFTAYKLTIQKLAQTINYEDANTERLPGESDAAYNERMVQQGMNLETRDEQLNRLMDYDFQAPQKGLQQSMESGIAGGEVRPEMAGTYQAGRGGQGGGADPTTYSDPTKGFTETAPDSWYEKPAPAAPAAARQMSQFEKDFRGGAAGAEHSGDPMDGSLADDGNHAKDGGKCKSCGCDCNRKKGASRSARLLAVAAQFQRALAK